MKPILSLALVLMICACTASDDDDNGTELPLCEQATNGFPYCQQGALTDPDPVTGELDGWGFEEDMSCVVPNGAADPNPGSCRLDLTEPNQGNSPNHILYNGEAIVLNGYNIAWLNFAADFGEGIDETRLREALQDLSDNGGNTLRWWLHIDGSLTPQWDTSTGLIIGVGGSLIADLQNALDIAAEYNVYLVPSLWSFDLLRSNDFRNPPNALNYRLLTEDSVMQSYIDNALVPMVKALNKHEQLIAWEIFNEPENMTEAWFPADADFYGGPVPTLEQLQRFQAKMAAAIHQEALANGEIALVTTGSKSMGKYNSDVAGGTNLYRDDRMINAADGDPLAVLDFYAPHYYNNEGKAGAWSPMHHDANYWNVDKPIVIGEFYADRELNVLNDPIAGDQMCNVLRSRGYAGAWAWQWNEHKAEVNACVKNSKP